MSSHHIVREKQEPALLIAGLDTFPDELLGQLLEWSPTVIVTTDTAEKIQSLGIKIDWLLADEMIDLSQSDVKLVPVGYDNPLTAGLKYLSAQGYPAVNIITDEILPGDYIDFIAQMDLIVFCGDKKIIAVRSGFSKWKPAGERIEILTLPYDFQYTGLLPVTDTIFKTMYDGFFSLRFSNTFLLLAEHLE